MALETFLAAIDIIRRTANYVVPKTASWAREELDKKYARIEKFEKHASEDGTSFTLASAHETAELLAAVSDIHEFRPVQMLETLDRSLFTQMFAEFDSFTGALLTAIYTNKADLLKGVSREVSLSELLEFDSLEAVKLNMLEKEIENFRRDSYSEQFATLEKKFGFKTLKDFPEWGEFIELSQRRNLLTHNGGRVSEQYLLVCDREGYAFKNRPSLGEILGVNGEYRSRAIVVLSKVGFMLAHTLWRKVFPHEVDVQAEAMNQTIYSMLEKKRWSTAAELSGFSLSEPMRKGVSEIRLRARIVNCAIALKFSGKHADAIRLIENFDWTATYRDFKLAVAVLNDDFTAAAQFMREIGKTGEMVNEVAYHQWPLFHKFRESEEFQNSYQEVYGVSFRSKVAADVAEARILQDQHPSQQVDASEDTKIAAKTRRTRKKGVSSTSKGGDEGVAQVV